MNDTRPRLRSQDGLDSKKSKPQNAFYAHTDETWSKMAVAGDSAEKDDSSADDQDDQSVKPYSYLLAKQIGGHGKQSQTARPKLNSSLRTKSEATSTVSSGKRVRFALPSEQSNDKEQKSSAPTAASRLTPQRSQTAPSRVESLGTAPYTAEQPATLKSWIYQPETYQTQPPASAAMSAASSQSTSVSHSEPAKTVPLQAPRSPAVHPVQYPSVPVPVSVPGATQGYARRSSLGSQSDYTPQAQSYTCSPSARGYTYQQPGIPDWSAYGNEAAWRAWMKANDPNMIGEADAILMQRLAELSVSDRRYMAY